MQGNKAEVLERIAADGVVAILRTPAADDALEIAEVLRRAGLQAVEIPLSVPGALEAIAQLAERSSAGQVVGAGTVLTLEDAIKVHQAGGRFIVTPVLDVAVIGYCRANGLACFPGGLTPTEIFTAWQAGADAVKVFPATAVGGPAYLAAVKAPLPNIELMPTGGVTMENAAAFIGAGAMALGVGGSLADVAALRSGKQELIAERAQAFLQVVREARAQR